MINQFVTIMAYPEPSTLSVLTYEMIYLTVQIRGMGLYFFTDYCYPELIEEVTQGIPPLMSR